MRVQLLEKELMEGTIMSAARPFVGLCVTCNNAKDCVHRTRRGSDAIYCEMFDGYGFSNGDTAERIVPVVRTLPDHTVPDENKGLCVNCAHRDTCKLPRPKGGVWHCEEYE